MNEMFTDMLAEGGKKNSLGRVNDVIKAVLHDKSRLKELYQIISHEDAWVRMRAIDAFEKICRERPEWIEPYINKIQNDLSSSSQPSIQWHIAQIYSQIDLSNSQKNKAISWLMKQLSTVEVDWIVAANAMKTLAYFIRKRDIKKSDLIAILETQANHKSPAVVKRAQKLLSEFS